MKVEDLRPGMRVRLVRRVDVFDLGMFPERTSGVVQDVDFSRQQIATIKLDDHWPCLSHWHNELQLQHPETRFAPFTTEDIEPVA